MRTLTKFLLEIPNPLMDEIVLSGDLKLYMDTSFETEWKVCTSAFVKEIPQSFKNKNVHIGDEVAVSYFVVADRTLPAADNNYFPVTKDNIYYEKYKNSNGFWLTKQAVPLPRGGIKWVSFLQDNYMNWVDGTEGTQSDVERWMSQFSFGGEDNFTYTNFIHVEGNQYWQAEDFNIFAKKDGKEIISVSDRIICLPVSVDLTTMYNIQNGTIEPPFTVVGMYTDRGRIISGGENIGLKKGDIIGFEPKFCEKYTLWNLECYLIKDDRVDLIWQPENNFINN